MRFSAAPSFTVTSGGNTHKWEFGRDFLVSFLRATKINGDLQVIDGQARRAKARLSYQVARPAEKRQETIMIAYEAGAAAVAA